MHSPILCTSIASAARAQLACWRAGSKGAKKRKKGEKEKKERKKGKGEKGKEKKSQRKKGKQENGNKIENVGASRDSDSD